MKRGYWRLSCLLAVFMTTAATAQDRRSGRSMVISREGIVAASQVLAAQAGAAVLAQGGGAVDAAIAANAVLGVVEPGMCGIGGDLFVLFREAKTGKLYGLNASGWAPRKMTRQALMEKALKEMPREGIHSVTVPGCADGWEKMHRKFGRRAWKSLFAAAIHYAEKGFPMQEMIQRSWESGTLKKDTAGARVFLPGGIAPKTGEIFRNPELGKAMRLLAERGAEAFYRGEIAEAILATSARLGGTMAAEDLAEFSSEWVEPVWTEYRGWRVYEMPPNGQGLAALVMLNILETFHPDGKPHGAAELHRKIEAMKLAYADLQFVADPRMKRVPVNGLLARQYAKGRAALIDAKKANCNVKAGEPAASDTTYLTVVDRDGNIASWIQSVSSIWGSGVVVDGMGFHLHNRGASFRFDEKHPNALVPRKRPFHTIIPALMEKDDTILGFGIMGGPNQPLAHAQFVSHIADFGMNLQEALEAPRFTKSRSTGCDVQVESRVGMEALQSLSALGHQIDIRQEYTSRMGRGNAVMRNLRTGVNYGASDPRADGAAVPEPLPPGPP